MVKHSTDVPEAYIFKFPGTIVFSGGTMSVLTPHEQLRLI